MSPPSSCHPPARHCAHVFQWDAAFPSFQLRKCCAPILGFWDNIVVLPFWVRETETETAAVPVFAERICFNPTVCLIYRSFRCNTCKAHPHIIFQQAGKIPIGKWVSFFSLSFFGVAKLLFSKDAKIFSAQTLSLVCLALGCEYFYTASNLLLFSNSFYRVIFLHYLEIADGSQRFLATFWLAYSLLCAFVLEKPRTNWAVG